MDYFIVTNHKIIQEIKKSKYFKVNLGISSTIDKNGERILNDKDQFAFDYNKAYKTTIYSQGSIGNMQFYTDYYIKENLMAVYYNHEEFPIKFDESKVKENGIDSFLGEILQRAKNGYEEIMESKRKSNERNQKKSGDADKLFNNPGSVTYEDLKKYMEKRNANRLF